MSVLSLDDQNRFLHETVSLSKSGVPLPEGLQHVARSAESGTLKAFSAHVAESLERGVSFGEAVKSSPVTAPPAFTALIECAEQGGDLNGVLDFALEQARRTKQYRASLLTAIIYPYMVFIVLVLVFLFVALFLIPKFKDIYDQLGAELPLPTQMVVNLSYLMVHTPMGLIPALVIVFMVLGLVVPALRQRLYQSFASIPGFSGLIILSDTALLMKFIEKMTARRVPLPTVLHAADAAMWHRTSRRAVADMASAAERGLPTSGHLPAGVPATAGWLYERAEEQGTLAETCGGIAEYCNDRFDILSKRAVGVLEPALILTVAVVIGMLVLSLYLPLFNIPRIIGS
jgi:type IV pilus assembly protein PilC